MSGDYSDHTVWVIWKLAGKSVVRVPERLIFFTATSSNQGDREAGEAVCGKSEQKYSISLSFPFVPVIFVSWP